MRASRPLATLTGIALLGIVLAACQDQAGGQITAHSGVRLVESITNPSVHGCHPFSEGVTHVDNYTQSSILLYTTPDCTAPPGGTSIYLSMQSSDEVVRSTGLWRSFSIAPE
ncbi:hypothetical protein [Streptomyces sp. NPDC020362]|uniref:hypothetical protein n=1 Tax=unclassified Streptomyces TaxID=2593676 RepID=UPI000B084797